MRQECPMRKVRMASWPCGHSVRTHHASESTMARLAPCWSAGVSGCSSSASRSRSSREGPSRSTSRCPPPPCSASCSRWPPQGPSPPPQSPWQARHTSPHCIPRPPGWSPKASPSPQGLQNTALDPLWPVSPPLWVPSASCRRGHRPSCTYPTPPHPMDAIAPAVL